MKTLAEWHSDKSPNELTHYLQVGDVVDEQMMWYFLEVLPPRCWTARIIQMGEPYDSDAEGKLRYCTLEKVAGKWMYAGVKLPGARS